jgi:hypothetical protein
MDELRRRAKSDLRPFYESLVAECERLLVDPPSTEEPPLYTEDMERGSQGFFPVAEEPCRDPDRQVRHSASAAS